MLTVWALVKVPPKERKTVGVFIRLWVGLRVAQMVRTFSSNTCGSTVHNN